MIKLFRTNYIINLLNDSIKKKNETLNNLLDENITKIENINRKSKSH